MSYDSPDAEVLAHFIAKDLPAHLEAKLRATRFVCAEREAELLELKGPCSTPTCTLHRAHRGPCDIPERARAADPSTVRRRRTP